MRKIKRKNICILIILLIAILFEIRVFTSSTANRLIEITANIVDKDGKASQETITLQATRQGESGYAITLPSMIKGKKIDTYIIKTKTISNKNNTEKENPKGTSSISNVTNSSPQSNSTLNATSNINNVNSTTNVTTNSISNVAKNISSNSVNAVNDLSNVINNTGNNISNTTVKANDNTADTLNTTKNVMSNQENSATTVTQKSSKEQDSVAVKEQTIQPKDSITAIEEDKLVQKIAGETLYLTQEELDSKAVELTVQYDSKQVENEVLYAKVLQNKEQENAITVEGYLPEEANVDIKKVTQEELESSLDEQLNENVEIEFAYDIKIMLNEIEYSSKKEQEEKLKVTINGIEGLDISKRKYKILHIHENETEIIDNIEFEGSSIIFETTKFSTYALLAEEIAPLAVPENVSLMSLGMSEMSNSTNTWDGISLESFRFGNGSQSNPYLITKASELAYLAQQVNNGNTFSGQYIQVANDINLNSMRWTPIGNTNNSFQGIFDGAGHIIANAIIIAENLPTNVVETYGIFGSIGGGASETIIRNVEFNSIEISLRATGNTSAQATQHGIHMGCVVGTMYNKSKVINVIVKSGLISDTSTITISSANFQLSAGGIAGYAANTSSSNTDPGTSNRYAIQNCFADVDIDLDATVQGQSSGQFHSGGIIGTIRSQPVWPEHCLYVGAISSNGFIGPIFGALINNTGYTNRNNYNTLWLGNDAGGNLTMTSYYSAYTANGTSFTTDRLSGTGANRISTRQNNIGYVQGVNKGDYESNISQLLSIFNSYTSATYMRWEYSNSTFNFIPRFNMQIQENKPTYTVSVENNYSTGQHSYTWYVDGEQDNTLNNQTSIIKEQDMDNTYKIEVLAHDGLYYSMLSFEIEPYSLYIEFDINEGNRTVNVSLEGDALPYVDLDDYTYQWYTVDMAEGNLIPIENETSTVLSNLESGVEYAVIATNNSNSYFTEEDSFVFGNRTVIFVDEENGNNSNNGFTPETAVKNFATAYNKLNSNGNRSNNIIVLIGDYTDTSFLNSATNNSYNKKANITGKYNGTEYHANLSFEGESTYRYLNADTTLQHLIINGESVSTNWWGSTTRTDGQTYFYLQGYSLTIGEGVVMENYSNANTNQGLIVGNSPGFHIIAGWLRYNYATLPRNNPEIMIKSGTYGRIILGGSPGTNAVSNLQNTTSRNFCGSSMQDMFNISVTIDIQNSTTPSNYDYDVNLLVGGPACGNTYANVVENIKSGKVGRVLGASIGDTSNKPNGWNYPINTFIGTTTINITGGNITELYGGCLGRNMSALTGSSNLVCDSYFYGTVTINISGGTISSNIYGAGAGGVSGYSANSTDVYKNYGQNITTSVNINASGGTINGNIYGGGYGYTEYLTAAVTSTDAGALYGNSNIVISGGTINGNVYGAGCGSNNVSGKTSLAQCEGNTSVTISGNPTINGSVYGAGMGISGMVDMAKMTGNTNIYLRTSTNVNIYGGGNISGLVGESNIYVEQGTHTAEIYGGGNIGNVQGNSNVYLQNGNISNAYGGGQSSNITNTNVYLDGASATNIYGGSNITGTVETSNVETISGTAQYVYGGNNAGGTTLNSHVETSGGTINDVYGGNNAGGTTNQANVEINSGTVNNVYGGGNQAQTGTTDVTITGNVESFVYGGGNQAGVNTDTNIYLNRSHNRKQCIWRR